MTRFSLTESQPQPGLCEIRIGGELDLAVADQLERALERAIADGVRVVIDLQGCEFIDSTGIAVIMRAHNRMAEDDRRIAVYGASDQVLRVLSVTGLTGNGLVFEEAGEALAATQPPGQD